jgi:hypothetical protein
MIAGPKPRPPRSHHRPRGMERPALDHCQDIHGSRGHVACDQRILLRQIGVSRRCRRAMLNNRASTQDSTPAAPRPTAADAGRPSDHPESNSDPQRGAHATPERPVEFGHLCPVPDVSARRRSDGRRSFAQPECCFRSGPPRTVQRAARRWQTSSYGFV